MLDAALGILAFLDIAVAPWRFLLSADYRQRRRIAWSDMYTPRAAMQIIGGVCCFFISIISIAVAVVFCGMTFFR